MGAQNVTTPGPRYLRLAEASELCSTEPETLRYWIWQGKLRSYKPGRHVLLREDELRAHIEACATGAGARQRTPAAESTDAR